ncbi:serine/threonine-protein phosphatase 2A activator [Episyrphus balteatus]|uniref:serine/threonine-protein phosphatase 2A activator n=1 Tax=Episyrphus balteatus TaxID=286459 RepID=UPI0024858CFD|nr:serine/threonine-protein phosphatase 2A activator [Episyrphus balteatus]
MEHPGESLVNEENTSEPSKCVKSVMDMAIWQKSQAYYDLIGFINGISTAIQGKKLTDEMYISKTMQNLLGMIEKFNKLLEETPRFEEPQRFGNQAYRLWFKKMEENAKGYLVEALADENCTSINELYVYLKESFGNPTRIDYGTGHELAFVMFLCCLFKTKVLVEEDNVACALKLFNSYLVFVRQLQKTYRMEPAGSQGVWSLDDYQFVPFIWGSAQLSFRSPFDPSKFLDQNIIDDYKDSYMFISCIDYISQVKTGHFAEHSNQLWSISAVPSWIKINSGLVKMYQKEILSKFPVIQHVYFGNLMIFKPVKPGTPLPNARLGVMPPPAAVPVKLPTEEIKKT